MSSVYTGIYIIMYSEYYGYYLYVLSTLNKIIHKYGEQMQYMYKMRQTL